MSCQRRRPCAGVGRRRSASTITQFRRRSGASAVAEVGDDGRLALSGVRARDLDHFVLAPVRNCYVRAQGPVALLEPGLFCSYLPYPQRCGARCPARAGAEGGRRPALSCELVGSRPARLDPAPHALHQQTRRRCRRACRAGSPPRRRSAAAAAGPPWSAWLRRVDPRVTMISGLSLTDCCEGLGLWPALAVAAAPCRRRGPRPVMRRMPVPADGLRCSTTRSACGRVICLCTLAC